MQSIFDERLWLAWLAKVRIIILTLLFGIELAIARLTPNPVSSAAVHPCHSAVVHDFDLLPAPAVLLGRTPRPGAAASRYRPGAGHAGGLCHRRRGQFAEFPLSPGHYCCLHPAASGLGVSERSAGVHSVCRGPGADVFRSHSFVFHHPSRDWARCKPSFSSTFSATWRWPTWRDCWPPSCARSM